MTWLLVALSYIMFSEYFKYSSCKESTPAVLQVGKAFKVPSGLMHRALVVPEAHLKLALMVRQLREDLAGKQPGGAPVRVIVFAGKPWA
jgi:hypothetical protein